MIEEWHGKSETTAGFLWLPTGEMIISQKEEMEFSGTQIFVRCYFFVRIYKITFCCVTFLQINLLIFKLGISN